MSTLLILHSRPLLSRHQAYKTHLKRSFYSPPPRGGGILFIYKLQSQNGHLMGHIHQLSATNNELQKIDKHCLC